MVGIIKELWNDYLVTKTFIVTPQD